MSTTTATSTTTTRTTVMVCLPIHLVIEVIWATLRLPIKLVGELSFDSPNGNNELNK